MPLFHEVAQYSEEYDRLKLGIPTSSNFHKIITPSRAPIAFDLLRLQRY